MDAEGQPADSVRSPRAAPWLGFASYAVAAAALSLLITSVMGRNAAGECLIGMGGVFMLTGFITRYLPESWRVWTWQSRSDNSWFYLSIGSSELFCGLVYHFTQNVFVVGVAYVLTVLLGFGVYIRVDSHLHRQEIEAHQRERTIWEHRRREQQVRSRIEYRLRR